MNPEAIQRIVGVENVLTDEDAAAYAVNGVPPAAAAAPGTREEAAEVILLAAREGWAVVPFGGGTQVELGFPPPEGFLALSTRRLDRLVDFQPDDMTVTVEPGMTLAALEAVLAERGQFLPLDPPLPERATVGGTVAAAASGPWRAAHGTPRDWVIGCRVVGADGQEIRGGGQVVKNVAGYDLPKLYTSSHGTLGLITEVTFKVMPRPPASGACRVPLPDAAAAEPLMAAVMDSDLQPSAVELLSPAYGESWLLLFEFLHVPEAVEWQLDRLASTAAGLGLRAERLEAVEPGGRPELLRLCRDAPAESPFTARLSAVSGRVAELAGSIEGLAGRHQVRAGILAHAATGQLFVTTEDVPAAFPEDLRGPAKAAGGTCVFPRLPAALVGQVDPWGEIGLELRLMQGIKKALDPSGVFSRGRFVGRL